MLPARSISMTRLLNWSVIRIFPGWLNPPLVVLVVLVAKTDGKAASARNTIAVARKYFFKAKGMFLVLRNLRRFYRDGTTIIGLSFSSMPSLSLAGFRHTRLL